MKKRILVLLAVVALMVACMVVSAQAAAFDLATFKCPCSACEAARLENPEYVKPTSEWATSLSGLVNGSHVYLSANTTVSSLSVGEGKEVVVVLDNKYLLFSSTSARAMLINGAGAKLHLIGTTGSSVVMSKTKTTNNGAFAQVSTGAELHLYGTLYLKMHGSAGPQPTSSGMIKLSNGKLHLHDAAAMGMGVSGAPRISASTLAGTGSSNQGGICKLEDANCVFTMDAGTLDGAVISMSGLGTGVPKHRVGRGGLLYNNGGTININGGTLKGAGSVTGSGTVSRGGLIYNAAGTLNITGGTFTADANMTGDYRGICVQGGTVNFAGGTINSANVGLGDGIGMLGGQLIMSGNATVKNADGTHSNNIYRWDTASAEAQKFTAPTIKLDHSWSGSASIFLNKHGKTSMTGGILSDYFIYGVLADGEFTAGGTKAKQLNLYLEDDNFDDPQLFGTGKVIVGCRAAIKADGKTHSWYITPAAAIAKYATVTGENKYIKLFANYTSDTENTDVSSEIYVDLNGYNQTDFALQEGGKVYAFDSAKAAGGKGATINVVAEPVTEINNKVYIVKNDGATSTVYPIQYKMATVSVRYKEGVAGVYYTATIKAHEELNATAGVAVSVQNDGEGNPSEDLADYLCTEGANNKGVYTGVLINNILNGDDKADRANRGIHACAYMTIDGTTYKSDVVSRSLVDVMEAVMADEYAAYNKLTDGQKTAFDALHEEMVDAGITLTELPVANVPSEPEDETV